MGRAYLVDEQEKIRREKKEARIRRGRVAEEKAFGALKYIQENKMELPGGRSITEIERMTPYSREDLAGIDFVVKFNTGEVLPIQVKNYVDLLATRDLRKIGGIYIVIPPYEDGQKTIRKIFNALSGFFSKNLKRGHFLF